MSRTKDKLEPLINVLTFQSEPIDFHQQQKNFFLHTTKIVKSFYFDLRKSEINLYLEI